MPWTLTDWIVAILIYGSMAAILVGAYIAMINDILKWTDRD